MDCSDFTGPLLQFLSRLAGWPENASRWDESGKGNFLKKEEGTLIPALYQWRGSGRGACAYRAALREAHGCVYFVLHSHMLIAYQTS